MEDVFIDQVVMTVTESGGSKGGKQLSNCLTRNVVCKIVDIERHNLNDEFKEEMLINRVADQTKRRLVTTSESVEDCYDLLLYVFV
ncbi:hypothetical protein Syun_006600 [Stephania yunnanensis]|uniref:Uncharacterized protein n=1 Tax=Stephania yunnanensis TaxID=152371 RepID=A0AAP0L0B3_9MAGN